MFLEKDLLGCLAELRYLHLEGSALHRVVKHTLFNFVLVSARMEHVVVINRVLLNAENQVDPQVNVLRNVVTLERVALLLQKLLWSGSPFRQFHDIDSFAVRTNSKIKFHLVDKKVNVVLVELRD
jgi:hypothetical protein